MYTCALWSKDRRLIKVISLLRMLIHGWMAIPFHGKITPASTPNSFFSIFPHFCIKSLLFGFEFPPFLLLRLPSAITSTEQFLYVSRFFSTLFISPKLYLSYISIKYIIYIYMSLCVNRIYLRQAYLHQKKAYAVSNHETIEFISIYQIYLRKTYFPELISIKLLPIELAFFHLPLYVIFISVKFVQIHPCQPR